MRNARVIEYGRDVRIVSPAGSILKPPFTAAERLAAVRAGWVRAGDTRRERAGEEKIHIKVEK